MGDSMYHEYSKEEKKRVQSMMDEVYVDFKEKVSKGRKLDLEKVEEIAKGRVWTGVQALENGLVDEIGGLTEALEYTKKQIGAKEGEYVAVANWPVEKSLQQQLLENFAGDKMEVQASSTLSHTLKNGSGGGVMNVLARLLNPDASNSKRDGDILLCAEVDIEY